MRRGPLTGIRVMELSSGIASAWASMIMADMGAEVIKIEAPTADGEISDSFGPQYNGQSFCYLAFNRNKQSVVLDLRTPPGEQALLDLVKVSDVLIEGTPPQSRQHKRFGYPRLRKANPRIIVWRGFGYGFSGSARRQACHEIVAQGYSGMLDLTREVPGKPPVKSAPDIGELGSGFYGLLGVLAALHQRQQTGKGQLVRTTKLASCMAMLGYQFSSYFLSNEVPKAVGSGHLGMLPQGAYKCKDGYVVIATGAPGIARLPGMNWISDDPRFATLGERLKRREEFNRTLEEHLSVANVRDWLELFLRNDIPAAPVNNLQEAAEDAQIQEQGMIVEVEHVSGGSIRMIDNPAIMSTVIGKHMSPPLRGQHTEDVLRGILGYSDEKMKQIRLDRPRR